ncbi:hypothetical protein MGN70_013846 [Eutypa lata]|nr:hypothetical protein MGN70_013846 [Eutypa lata]
MVKLTTLAVLLAPLGALAGPMSRLSSRQLEQPPPCVREDPPPSEAETKARFDKFANAFIVTKNITEAFLYIADDYINHNPAAENGAKSAVRIPRPVSI